MGTISAKRIEAQLKKAKNVGKVFEPFVVTGCEVVLQSLLPADYEAINEEIKDLDDLSYVNAFRMGHVCRSAVEIDGVSLRDVDYVEIEVPDPKNGPDAVKSVKVERHVYVRDFILNTWGKEAIDVTFRKFTDVVMLAEKASVEGVHFVTPDEETDEKFRRLVSEAKDAEESVPQELAERILSEFGYTHKTTASEMAGADQILKSVDTPVEPPEPPVRQVAVATPPVQRVSQPPPPPSQEEVKPQRATPEALERMLAGRVPMNQQASSQAIPLPPSGQPQRQVISTTNRRNEIAALEAEAEADVDPGFVPAGRPVGAKDPNIPPNVPVFRQEARLLEKRQVSVPGKLVIDAPPMAGLNPHWKPQPK